MLPTYSIFYKNESCLNNLLNNISQFRNTPIKETSEIIKWDHYALLKIKCDTYAGILNGHGRRVWGIFIERCLCEEMLKGNHDIYLDILEPMLVVYEELGCGIKIID